MKRRVLASAVCSVLFAAGCSGSVPETTASQAANMTGAQQRGTYPENPFVLGSLQKINWNQVVCSPFTNQCSWDPGGWGQDLSGSISIDTSQPMGNGEFQIAAKAVVSEILGQWQNTVNAEYVRGPFVLAPNENRITLALGVSLAAPFPTPHPSVSVAVDWATASLTVKPNVWSSDLSVADQCDGIRAKPNAAVKVSVKVPLTTDGQGNFTNYDPTHADTAVGIIFAGELAALQRASHNVLMFDPVTNPGNMFPQKDEWFTEAASINFIRECGYIVVQ